MPDWINVCVPIKRSREPSEAREVISRRTLAGVLPVSKPIEIGLDKPSGFAVTTLLNRESATAPNKEAIVWKCCSAKISVGTISPPW